MAHNADENSSTIVTSVTEFLTSVQKIRDLKGWFKNDKQWSPWFRGEKWSETPLTPKLYRTKTVDELEKDEVEDEIREEFIKRAPVHCDRIPNGPEQRAEWEWYFMMRHFGASTRLLDWTEGAFIALYFAVRDNREKKDAVVWVLDPYELNKHVIGKAWIIPPSATGVTKKDQALVAKWLPSRFSQRRLPNDAVAIEPTHVVSRMSSQHSCFTIHGRDPKSLKKFLTKKPYCIKKLLSQPTMSPK